MEVLLISLSILGMFMSLLFVLALVVRNNGIADVGYDFAFMVVVVATLMQSTSVAAYTLVLSALPFIWGIRLATRIYLKNRGKPEDFRYRTWRDSWGRTFVVRSFFQIYLLQGVIVFLIALPVTLAIVFPGNDTYTYLFTLGIAAWVVGFLFQAIGDYQLDQFLTNPANKGRIMMSGLWRYSRHPNYFGESVMWFGIAIAAMGVSSYPLIGFVSPILITYLLLKVSGVPLLEKRWEGNPEWDAYKSRTSVFIPLPVRS